VSIGGNDKSVFQWFVDRDASDDAEVAEEDVSEFMPKSKTAAKAVKATVAAPAAGGFSFEMESAGGACSLLYLYLSTAADARVCSHPLVLLFRQLVTSSWPSSRGWVPLSRPRPRRPLRRASPTCTTRCVAVAVAVSVAGSALSVSIAHHLVFRTDLC
jgi:hypothetical protein